MARPESVTKLMLMSGSCEGGAFGVQPPPQPPNSMNVWPALHITSSSAAAASPERKRPADFSRAPNALPYSGRAISPKAPSAATYLAPAPKR